MPGARGCWRDVGLFERRICLFGSGSFVLIDASPLHLGNFWRQNLFRMFRLFLFCQNILSNIGEEFIDYVCCNFPMGIGKFLEGKLKRLKKLVTFFFPFFFTLCWFIDFPLFYSLMLGGNFFIKKVMLLKWLIDHDFLFNLLAVFFFFFIFLHFFFFFFKKIHSRVMKSK